MIIFLIIVVILSVGFYAIYSSNKTYTYNINQKYRISGNVVDLGIYKNLDEVMDKIQKAYYENKDKGEIYFVYGNAQEVKLARYTDLTTGNLIFNLGEGREKIEVKRKELSLQKIIPQNNEVEIKIDGKSYLFNLKSQENLYMIIKETNQGVL